GTRDAGVHLDQPEVTRLRLVGELDVRAAGRDPDRAGAGNSGLAQALVVLVGQRLLRGDRPRVSRVDAQRIDVLDRADNDAVARRVAHHFELVLQPAVEEALDEHLSDRARTQAGLDSSLEPGAAPRATAAGPAQA